MDVLAGLFAVAAVLLAGAGAAKVLDPTMTVGALRAAGLPASALGVRLGAAAELALAATALVVPNALVAAGVGLSYVAFAVFVVRALRRGTPIASCGCFGRADTPPSAVHVVVDAAFAVVAIAAALTGGVDVPAVVADQPLAGVPFLLAIALGVALAVLALTVLPRTLRAARS